MFLLLLSSCHLTSFHGVTLQTKLSRSGIIPELFSKVLCSESSVVQILLKGTKWYGNEGISYQAELLILEVKLRLCSSRGILSKTQQNPQPSD
jgi:hypothetical protein